MTLSRTHCVALLGVEGHIVEIEVHLGGGDPGVTLVGLPDAALREARDRIRAALANSGEAWPSGQITISLSPASLPKSGSLFDLAIAAAVLAAEGSIPPDPLAGSVLIAELGLDGRARPVRGVLPAVIAARERGHDRFVVARGNAAEASLVPDIEVIAVDSLEDLCLWAREGIPPQTRAPDPVAPRPCRPAAVEPDLADVLGQPVARRAVEIAAAGGHNLMMLGPPGTGKSLLAERLPTVLPRLEPTAALEATAIHSVAGLLPEGAPLVTMPPFAAPHHTSTRSAIIGGGSGHPVPGWVSKAHQGVLFVDEAPQFGRGVLDSLREPLERGEVVLARASSTVTFPARFQLVLAANPCPCARPGTLCECPAGERRRYFSRISGPLLDRIDLKVELPQVGRAELLADRAFAESSAVVAARVSAARERAARRLAGTPWSTNSQVPGAHLRRDFPVEQGALRILGLALDQGRISARGVDRTLRVAWTLADLADRDRPGEEEVAYAFALWSGRA
ncbi:YifB family Mg chelatase-like AAA ATPase [Nocardiopsis lambiniae]|uniref:YifB family Mg chelatase-like AAA ATPase n=1 Tax=Nocardiopsis lambiniae TaxID=3075539 RepID=A0ABU2M571_9ACTN|nr:YifB family Mg chelatase-like AAA ATPase [Nocardiopsis sp. DSM 44743]MDT0327795.1 YifB family Mg chelatase-like AAA ATPase [Nocardiopsis sp. DSM 44743]